MIAAEYNAMLPTAHAVALDKLMGLLEKTEDPREVRLIATGILRLKPLQLPEVTTDSRCSGQPALAKAPTSNASPAKPLPAPATPAPTAHPNPATPTNPAAPLTESELRELARHLPNVSPDRFTRKHSPAYWRRILDDRRRRTQPVAA